MPEAATDQAESLNALRARIDAIDDALHDLLMHRAVTVERVAREGGKVGVKIRPGREAVILRRLLARHQGAMAPQAIIRIWRELFAAALVIEGGLVIAVCDGGSAAELPFIAREHFGPLTPIRRHRTPAQALADLATNAAQAAVLPMPSEEDDTASAWWVGLMHGSAPRLSIIGKLPFWGRRVEGTPQGEAYVVAALQPDASGADRSLIGIETEAEISRAKIGTLMNNAGFAPGPILLKRDAARETVLALVEVDGLVTEDDPRLAAITGTTMKPVVLGSYAIPVAP